MGEVHDVVDSGVPEFQYMVTNNVSGTVLHILIFQAIMFVHVLVFSWHLF
jgi:hypothetical protein